MFYHSKIRSQQAFGLVELMVSISIMALISTIIVSRQSAFNGAILLRNQAYEVAFALREAQQLAVSGSDTTVRTYGVYFDTSSATDKRYIIFADKNGNNFYDAGEEVGLPGKLDSRFEIRKVSPAGGGSNTQLAVVFTRPNFDASFCTRAVTSCTAGGPAYIDIARSGVSTNGTGDVRRVEITETGQISVITY